MTQQDDARKALTLIEQDISIPEGVRERLRALLNDPADAQVVGFLTTVRDDTLPNSDRLTALRNIVKIAQGGTVP